MRLALLILSAGFLLLTTTQPLNPHDEGVAAYTALRVLYGDVPYRDYWTFYAPGQTYAVAALFRLVGPSLIALRLYDATLRIALVLVIFGLAAHLTSPRAALIPAGLATIWLGEPYAAGSNTYPSLLLCLLGLGALFAYAHRPRAPWLVAAGALAGGAGLFRHDFGTCALLSIGVGLLALARSRGSPVRRLVLQIVLVGAGAGAAVLPVLGALLLSGVSLATLWESLVVFPARELQRVRALPLPPVWPLAIATAPVAPGRNPVLARLLLLLDSWIPLYLPPVFALATAGGSVAALRRGVASPLAVRLLPLAALSLLFWVRAISRADRAHLLPVAIVTAVLGAALCYRLWRRLGGGGQPREADRGFGRLALAGAAGAVLLLGYTYVARPVEAWARTVDPALLPSLPRCGGCALVDADERAALALVRDLTAPDERIFVGTARHDLIQLNDVMFYFLAPRRSATRYHVLHPGVATTAPVQGEIVDELNRRDVRVVVLWSGDALPDEANESSVSSGVTLLDDYLRSTYRQVAAFGPYSVWRRP